MLLSGCSQCLCLFQDNLTLIKVSDGTVCLSGETEFKVKDAEDKFEMYSEHIQLKGHDP